MKTYEKVYQILQTANDYISGEKLAQMLNLSRTSIWKAIQQLEARGLNIDSVNNLGYRLQSGDLISPEWLAEQLPLTIKYKEESHSTQLDAKQGMEAGQSANTLYLAPSQAAARGRFGRPFFAPKEGGIYMSLHLAPQIRFEEAPAYTVLVAASIVQAIHNLTQQEVQIKWVNDIYLGQKKIAGILTEAVSSIETGQINDVIIGVGLNFHIPDFPVELQDKVTSLFQTQPTITRNQLIAEIWRIFLTWPQDKLIEIYRTHSLVLGHTVQFTQQTTTYTGQALDVDQSGRLLVRLTDGTDMWLNSGEISLSQW